MNRLSKESSPYLLQHANNPVDWFPWGEEALNKAEKENKLLIISIGYAACHWCHVMEHECFEDEEVAKFMNEHFVSIKVDREERPDIDRIYMEAVVIMQRQGGWPLNCIALPDGRPIYGGTYFPKRDWLNVLAQLANLYKNDIDKANSYGDQMADVLRRGAMLKKLENPLSLQKEDIETVVNEWLGEVDAEWGGFYAERNKFVMPVDWDLLLEVAYYTEKEAQQDAIDNNLEFHGHEALHHALKLTLNRIAQGGIYDHIGGGFARYSVDRQWQVPHFEKMLYDNAQLVSLYAKAYQFYQEPAYKKVVYQTIEFVERELTDASGAFYSALDADSEGEEGKFYCWTLQEVLDIEEEVTSKIENGLRYLFAFGLYYSLDEEGNWEHGRNVIWAKQSLATFAEQQNLPLDLLAQNFEVIRQILLAKRSKRIRPALDDKCLTSWNGLMLKALVDAYVVFREESWLSLALNNARHIWENVTDSLPRAISPEIKVGARMYRNYKNGQSSIPAFLDDYAHAIEAFLALYSVTFDETWITRAQFYLNYVIQHFYDEKSGFFYYTSNAQPEIITRKTEFTDDVIPSSCGILAHCLAKFSVLTGDLSYQKLADQMLQNVQEGMKTNSRWYAKWWSLALKQLYPQYEVVITGENALEFEKALHHSFRPDLLFAGAIQAGNLSIVQNRMTDKTLIYVCQNNSCLLPVDSVEKAEELFK